MQRQLGDPAPERSLSAASATQCDEHQKQDDALGKPYQLGQPELSSRRKAWPIDELCKATGELLGATKPSGSWKSSTAPTRMDAEVGGLTSAPLIGCMRVICISRRGLHACASEAALLGLAAPGSHLGNGARPREHKRLRLSSEWTAPLVAH